jgi:hypothetical protein
MPFADFFSGGIGNEFNREPVTVKSFGQPLLERWVQHSVIVHQVGTLINEPDHCVRMAKRLVGLLWDDDELLNFEGVFFPKIVTGPVRILLVSLIRNDCLGL